MTVSPWACSLSPQEAHEAARRRRKREERELIAEGFRQRRHPLPMPEGLNVCDPVKLRQHLKERRDAHLGNPTVIITNRPPGLKPAMVRRSGAPPKEPGRANWRLQEPVRKPDESDVSFNTRLRKYERLMRAVT